MAENPACQSFLPLLSPFIDGELAPAERVTVERHLTVCSKCTMRVADLRAESGLLRVGMEMLADEVDFKDFSQKVLARVTPEKPPLFERLKLAISEAFLYQKGTYGTALATAAVLALLALPVLLRDRTPLGYASQRLEVQVVSVDEKAVDLTPAVMETEGGDAIVWMVEHTPDKGEPAQDEAEAEELELSPKAPAPLEQKPKGGEL